MSDSVYIKAGERVFYVEGDVKAAVEPALAFIRVVAAESECARLLRNAEVMREEFNKEADSKIGQIIAFRDADAASKGAK